MKEFEYKIELINEQDNENRAHDLLYRSTEMLNKLGSSGWELVAVHRSAIWEQAFFYVFKKQVED